MAGISAADAGRGLAPECWSAPHARQRGAAGSASFWKAWTKGEALSLVIIDGCRRSSDDGVSARSRNEPRVETLMGIVPQRHHATQG